MNAELLKKIERKNKERQMLKNCCRQKWATKKEIKHWLKGINEYDKEIFMLQEMFQKEIN